MKLTDFIEGLETLKPYYNDPAGYHIGADHDTFYAYATDKPLSERDAKKMQALGWFQESRGEDEDPPYYPDEGWSAFT